MPKMPVLVCVPPSTRLGVWPWGSWLCDNLAGRCLHPVVWGIVLYCGWNRDEITDHLLGTYQNLQTHTDNLKTSTLPAILPTKYWPNKQHVLCTKVPNRVGQATLKVGETRWDVGETRHDIQTSRDQGEIRWQKRDTIREMSWDVGGLTVRETSWQVDGLAAHETTY